MKSNLLSYVTFVAIAALPIAYGDTTVVRIDQSTLLRAKHIIDASDPESRFPICLSSDLSNWSTVDLSFRQSPGEFIPAAESGIVVFSQNEIGNSIWEVELELPLSETIFTKVEPQSGPFTVDPTVSAETANLLRNLHRIGWDTDGFMMGQEFPLSFTLDGSGDHDTSSSDVKDVVGDHPGVHGSDFHYMIDKDPAESARHKAAARAAYEAGAIVTFDYHWRGRYGESHSYDARDAQLAANVVNDDDSMGDVTWFYQHLDDVLDIINNDLQFPIVFRPLHEMDGDWFWWGSRIPGGAESYRVLYRKLVDYMKPRTEYVLFCWSPDVIASDPEPYYPGDDHVDVVGRDIYRARNTRSLSFMLGRLTQTVNFAQEHGKVAAFTETGYNAGSPYYIGSDDDWWTTQILDPIKGDSTVINIAWVLTWINTSWSGPYAPHSGANQAAKDDFIQFYNDPATLFQEDVAAMNVYDPPPSE